MSIAEKTTKKAEKAPKALPIPAFLNYNRSVSPGKGVMWGVTTDGVRIPAQVLETTVRGSISSYGNIYTSDAVTGADAEREANKQKNPQAANIQTVDVASLPQGCDRLEIDFSIVVQANSIAPAGCGEEAYGDALREFSSLYDAAGGYTYLAERYVWNIINGRAAWRNAVVQDMTVKIRFEGDRTVTFPCDGIALRSYPGRAAMPEGFDEVVESFAAGLRGGQGSKFFSVTIGGRLPAGAEIYPSQEFIRDGKSERKQKGDKSKTLSSINVVHDGKDVRQATIHSQKLGNAIRTIDEWHGKANMYGAIAVEPFGFVQSRLEAIRLPGKEFGADFYAILKRIQSIVASMRGKDLGHFDNEVHFVAAILVRGGVFSGKD